MLFSENGIERLNLFIKQLIEFKLEPKKNSNAESQKLRANLEVLFNTLINFNEEEDLSILKETLPDLFNVIDNNKQTCTPAIYNDESKAIFILYLELLRDSIKNWDDYITKMTRAKLVVFGVSNTKIVLTIKRMEYELDLYQSREKSAEALQQRVTVETAIQTLFANIASSNNNETTQQEAQSFKNIYETIIKMPLTIQSDSAINCTSAKDYEDFNGQRYSIPCQASLITYCIDMECTYNQTFKQDGRRMIVGITPIMKRQINEKAPSELKRKIDYFVKTLSENLTDYCNGNGNSLKRELAKKLLQSIEHFSSTDNFTKPFTLLSLLKKAQWQHHNILIRESISGGELEKILNEAQHILTTKIVNTITLTHYDKVVEHTLKSLEVLNTTERTLKLK